MMVQLIHKSMALTNLKAGTLIAHDDTNNTIWPINATCGGIPNGVALMDCKAGEQCEWGIVAQVSGFDETEMPDVYMKSSDAAKERAELWAEVSKVFDSYLPYVDTGSESLYAIYMSYTAMLDLHQRMLEMERKLDEAIGDGK